METRRIGMIGLDTSHATAFTELLNNPQNPAHVAGGKVTIAFPGGSPDLEISHSRVEGFTTELKEKHGVEIVDSPEAVAENCDLLFIESVDGRVHLEQLKRTLKFRRPTYIDKPLAHSHAEAKEIFRLAEEAGIPIMSSSSLRYNEALQTALADDSLGTIGGCDAWGPMDDFAMPPNWFWYGIHAAEIVYRVMGHGCRELQVVNHRGGEVVTALWNDGRLATIRGMRGDKTHKKFGATIHRLKGYQQPDMSKPGRPGYASLLDAIMRTLPNGSTDVPKEQTLELMRFLEAANESRKDGRRVQM